ncbi:hypothetical protein BJ741DRAFT_574059 [Chytriomyces cf. hyalinus JEL632]|nr:hypothetical protein BJ741DRAFT_574059 [Chytriomyces cf. hyalinus JEL632]
MDPVRKNDVLYACGGEVLFLLLMRFARAWGNRRMEQTSGNVTSLALSLSDCGADNTINPREPIRCRDCGHRILYKKRTQRSVGKSGSDFEFWDDLRRVVLEPCEMNVDVGAT